MRVELRATPFDAMAEVSAYRAVAGNAGKSGAISVFVGAMRDFNAGEAVHNMTLEHYPGMTEKHLQEICEQAQQQWAVQDILLLHRTGDIEIGADIVLVATWAAHRGDALDATRYIIEDLKHRAPFWKKETVNAGQRWVDCNTSGYSSA